MSDQNNGAAGFGGIVVFLVMALWGLKQLDKASVVAGRAADHIGNAVASAFGALFSILGVVALIAAGIAAVYWLYRWAMVAKKGTEIKATLENDLSNFRYRVQDERKEFEAEVERQLSVMRQTLYEALKEPEVAIAPPSPAKAADANDEAAAPASDSPTTETGSAQGGSDADMSAVSNPY